LLENTGFIFTTELTTFLLGHFQNVLLPLARLCIVKTLQRLLTEPRTMNSVRLHFHIVS
jgi:hypothetical protein